MGDFIFPVKLNPQQMEAATCVDGAVLLLAVPGSGKTTVLVSRLGYMINEHRIPASRILTLTYTVAAAGDMSRRYESYFGDCDGPRPEFRTINGICAKIIAWYSNAIGKESFRLVTEEKNTSGMLTQIYKDVEKDFPTESDLKGVRTLITYIKNMMLTAEEIEELEKRPEVTIKISQIFKAYNQRLREEKLMDYDDQMIYALNILKKEPAALEYFQNLYPYICVDEAQDTSRIQHVIIALLASKTGNLFMVGDEDQSIYGFRAAYPQALLNFEAEHPGAKVLLMEENYRSNANIVSAADSFIRRNTLRHEKNMKAVREAVSQVETVELKARRAQYTYLAKVARDCDRETAVLYRYNESAIPLVDLLEREGINYRLRKAENQFFSNRTVLDIERIMMLALNPRDEEAFMQVYYKLSMYLKKQDAISACSESRRRGVPILDAAIEYLDLNQYTVMAVKSIRTHLKNMCSELPERAIGRIVSFMGYGEYLERVGMGDGRIEIMRTVAARETSISDFLFRMEFLDNLFQNKDSDPNCQFILSTIHASKGLEYDRVYLMDVSDGLFPEVVLKNMKKAKAEEIRAYEEERRIFYVGVTRAKNHLVLFRLLNGSTFINELVGRSERAGKKLPFVPGLKVRHFKFGTGTILEVGNDIVKVRFDDKVRLLNIAIVSDSSKMTVL